MMKVRVITAAISLAFATLAFVHAQPAEAKGKLHHQVKVHRVIRDAIPTNQLSAKRHSYRHHARGGGSCDGFQRCRCGTTAARYYGLPYDYNGWNLKEARAYYNFPHTSFHVGVAGVIPHHVVAITGGSDCAHAMVHDDAGDYQRNVCGMTFVDVRGGGGYTQTASAASRRQGHHHRGAVYAENTYTPVEPQAIH